MRKVDPLNCFEPDMKSNVIIKRYFWVKFVVKALANLKLDVLF